jgi:FixJ family two-component response regulator
MLTDREEKKLRAELREEKKAHREEKRVHKKTKAKVKWLDRKEEAIYKAFTLRKSGMTWKKIAKEVKAPESTVRLATQRRFKATWLKGRWSEEKLSVSDLIDVRTKAMLAKRGDTHPKDYEELVRQAY